MLVAEKVMGETLPQAWSDLSAGPSHGDPGGYRIGVKPYSTDISAAMEVLNKMNDGPWSIVRSDHPSAKDTPYEVSFGRHGGRHSSRVHQFSASADTLPKAICLAALAAMSEGGAE